MTGIERRCEIEKKRNYNNVFKIVERAGRKVSSVYREGSYSRYTIMVTERSQRSTTSVQEI